MHYLDYREQSENIKGKRIKCLHMMDDHPVLSGELGTIRGVDDIGTIQVNWDSGSTLGLVPDVDEFEILN